MPPSLVKTLSDLAKKTGVDITGFTVVLHAHSYSLSHSLTRALGPTQAFLMNEYAKSLAKLLEGEEYVKSLSSFCTAVEGMAKCRYEGEEDKLIFEVVECPLAPFVHPKLGMDGHTGHLCPLAALAMVALAKERGWKPDENVFDYVRFAEKLTFFGPEGSKTIFRVVK